MVGTLASEQSMQQMMKHIPRMIVARPLAVPIPLPRIALGPTRLNLAIDQKPHRLQPRDRAHIGAF